MYLSIVARLAVLAADVATPPPAENLGFFETVVKRYTAGGWGMKPITICLGFLIWILADRITTLFFTGNINKEAFVRGLKKHIYAGDLDKAISYVAGQRNTPLTSVLKAGLMKVPAGEGAVQFAVDEAALRENPKIEKRTGYLAMIGNAAMLCGLLGTVSGLIGSFEAVARANPAEKAEKLAAGISEAMNCTAFGLLTAIPALVMFSLLMGRTQHMLDDVNETTVGVLNLIMANRDKLKMPDRMPAAEEE